MQIGMSTACFYPMNTEVALEQILLTDSPSVEIFINADSELEVNYINRLRRCCDLAGVQVVSVHPYTSGMEGMYFFSGYDRRAHDGREYYKKYYRAANLLGCKNVVFHGAHHVQDLTMEQYAECYDPIMQDAKAMGARLCHENVVRCRSGKPEFFTELTRLLPSVQYVLDCKQAVRAGVSPTEMAKAMGERVVHLHLSDHTPTDDCLTPGCGTMDFEKLYAGLRTQGFEGTAVVELYRENFENLDTLQQGRRYLQSLWSDK